MSHDTWIHRGARVLVRPLAHAGVHPNHVTAARLVSGLAASGCFALASRDGEVAGAALFLLSILCDRIDGELARQTGRSTRAGHYFDLVADACCNSVVLLGVGLGLRESSLGALGPWLGAFAGITVALTFVLVIMVEARSGPGSVNFTPRAGFDPDDAMVMVPIAVLAGGALPLVIAAAIGAPIAALVVAKTLLRRSSAAHPQRAQPGPHTVDAGPDPGQREERLE